MKNHKKNNFKFFIKILLTVVVLCEALLLEAKNYRILVLPSGGATSVCQAHLLCDIESKTGLKINQLFDEIWCSSAGAIIAALSEQKDSVDILNFIETNF